ncbi:MAG TPA: hypothetical protein VFW96_13465 [Thermomicrobiales bacterium]|nr:hypothetical protein [Thermomicrobiales bacterium]
MGLTGYEIALTAEDYLRIRIMSERGQVVDFTVQYEAVIAGKTYPVVRYDAAHGQPHRDLLDATGHNIDKLWYGSAYTYAQVVQIAIADLRTNWPQYRADFIGRMP